jgi:uncharacterized protein (TIGR03083 family)
MVVMNAATQAGAGIDYVGAYASAAEWFADHVARTNSRAAVPTCPGWTVLDLVTHLGNVHSWAATVIETGRPATKLDDRPSSAKPKRLGQWYLGKAEDLYSVLRDVSPDHECWNFAFGAGVARFWLRRQTHETLLHGVDLAVAAEVAERLPVELADDGVDEALNVFLHRMHARGHPADLAGPVVLKATDTGRCWVVEPAPRASIPAQASGPEGWRPDRSAPRVSNGFREGADRVEAPAAVLFKLLWKRTRPTDPEVAVRGDEETVHRFLASRLTP